MPSIRLAASTLAMLFLIGVPWYARAAADRIFVEQRTVTLASGEAVDYEIGTLYVPENRHKPSSRTIGVGFARIKGLTPTGAPPVFWLPGGPGLSVLEAFTENSETAQGRLRSWLGFRSVGDLVVVEQRGYTTRGEKLLERSQAFPLDRPASVRADA